MGNLGSTGDTRAGLHPDTLLTDAGGLLLMTDCWNRPLDSGEKFKSKCHCGVRDSITSKQPRVGGVK